VRRIPTVAFVALALALAVGLATALSPFASSSPDGLQKVAGQKGFLDEGTVHSVQKGSPIPGYAFPGIADQRLATAAAGFAGTLAVFLVGAGLAWALRRARGGGGETAAR
jgi:hypothetical protein